MFVVGYAVVRRRAMARGPVVGCVLIGTLFGIAAILVMASPFRWRTA